MKLQFFFWAVLIFLLTVLSSGQTEEPFLSVRSMALSTGILICLIGFYGLGKANFKMISSKNTKFFFAALVGFGLWQIITSAMASNPAEAFFPISKYILFSISIYLIFQFLQSQQDLSNFFIFFTLLFSAHALFGIYQYLLLETGTPDEANLHRFSGHRNLWGSFLAAGSFFSIYQALYGKKYWQIIGTIASLLILSGIFISQSRSAWLAFMSGGLVWMILSFIKKGTVSFFNKKFLAGSLGVFLILGSVFFVSTAENQRSFSDRFRTLTNIQIDGDEREAAAGSIVFRIKTWKQSLEMLADHPLTGVGRGNWKIQIPRYGVSCYEESTGAIVRRSAHNDYLEIACETGFIGFAFLLILMMSVALTCKIGMEQKRPEAPTVLKTFALTASLSALSTDMLFSFPFDRPEHLMLAAFSLAGLFSLSDKDSKNADPALKRPLILIPLLSLATGALFIAGTRFHFESRLNQARTLFYQSDYIGSIEKAEKAKSIFHGIGQMGDPPELYGGMAKHISRQPDEALEDFEVGLKKHPNSARLLNAKGSLFSTEKKYEKAVEVLEKALRLTPNHEVIKKISWSIIFELNNGKNVSILLKQCLSKMIHGFIQCI